jgi:salicylate hydroxylase
MDDEEKLKRTLHERLRWLWDLDIDNQVESARQLMIQIMHGKGHID